MTRMRSRPAALARSIVLAVGWLVAATLIALGAAGIATGIGGPPGGPARPELTWAGDRAIEPGLTAAKADLEAIRDDVAALSLSARTALAALVATDRGLLEESIEEGSGTAEAVDAAVAELRASLLDLPAIVLDPNGDLSPRTALALDGAAMRRFERLDRALRETRVLAADWTRFSAASLAAQRLTTLLIDHDATTAAAAASGRSGRYDEALAGLDTSDALIAEARLLRDRLANTVDVVTLTEWIDRNAAYDKALRGLYDALARSGGRVNDEVRAAFATERDAKDRLPPDTRGLTIILAEIARGGINEIAIAIEETRAALDDALADLEVGAGADATGG
jgi:hypothetical protein